MQVCMENLVEKKYVLLTIEDHLNDIFFWGLLKLPMKGLKFKRQNGNTAKKELNRSHAYTQGIVLVKNYITSIFPIKTLHLTAHFTRQSKKIKTSNRLPLFVAFYIFTCVNTYLAQFDSNVDRCFSLKAYTKSSSSSARRASSIALIVEFILQLSRSLSQNAIAKRKFINFVTENANEIRYLDLDLETR